MIVTDVDGTLVPESTSRINPELHACIRQIKDRGLRFVAASGRQYQGVLAVFREVAKDMIFIAENGAYIIENDVIRYQNVFREQVWKEIVRYLKTREDVYIMLSGIEGTYSDHPDPPFKDMLINSYGMELNLTDDLTSLSVSVSKVAVYCPRHNPVEVAEAGRRLFGEVSNVLVSGEVWMDFMPPGADKGNALARVQTFLGISPEETMAFGDNSNDIGMLQRAAYSYAVSGAREDVKQAARHVMTEGVEDDGVLHVLQDLLRRQDPERM